MKSEVRHIFFSGIGGAGMSGLAEILMDKGFYVSGSDREKSETTMYLSQKGARIYQGHHAENLGQVDLLVYSSAVPADNAERVAAKERGIPQIRRAQMLADLMLGHTGIGVAGTHGKTTTTAMCAEILIAAGLDPTVVVGGRLKNLKTNARLGGGSIFLTEADEFDRSFLTLMPTYVVITSLEADHLDCYADFHDIRETFRTFAGKLPFFGALIACTDDPAVSDLLQDLNHPVVSYGIGPGTDVTATGLKFNENESRYRLKVFGRDRGEIRLSIPGIHNVRNSLAAIALAMRLNVDIETIRSSLAGFAGVQRRFQIKGVKKDIMVVDDYAHHPTEVRAALEAARAGWDRRLIAVFQPHLYSRTRDFYREFARALFEADVAVLAPIYPAREDPIPGVTSRMISEVLEAENYPEVHTAESADTVPRLLVDITRSGDMVMTLGAGDVYKCGELFLDLLGN